MSLPEEFPAAEGTPIEPAGQGGPSRGAGVIGGSTGLIGVEEPTTGGRPVGPSGGAGRGGERITLIGVGELIVGGRQIGPSGFGLAGTPVVPIGVVRQPTISAPAAAILSLGTSISPTFNILGAPIAILGGVFEGGLPIGGPVTQIFRGGAAPVPNTLFINTLSPGGPIQTFFIGSQGAPIGVDTFGGGALPIGPAEQVAGVIASIGPRSALVGAPAITFESELPQGGGPI